MHILLLFLLISVTSFGEIFDTSIFQEKYGPPDPKETALWNTGIILFNMHRKGVEDPQLPEEIIVKAAVLAAAKKEMPNLTEKTAKYLSEEYYRAYRTKDWLNIYQDTKSAGAWALNKGGDIRPLEVKTMADLGVKITPSIKELLRGVEKLVNDIPGYIPKGPRLMPDAIDSWMSFEQKKKAADNILFVMQDPMLKKVYAATTSKVTEGDILGDPLQFQRANQLAANSTALLAIRSFAEKEKLKPKTSKNHVESPREIGPIPSEELRVAEEILKETRALFSEIQKLKKYRPQIDDRDATLLSIAAGIEAMSITAAIAFPDSKPVRAVCEVAQASVQIAQLSTLIGSNLTPYAFFSSYTVVLNLVSNLMGLFSNQKTDTQIILEAINSLREQIEDLHQDMDNRFYDQRNKLDHMMGMINRQFDRLERQLHGETFSLEDRVRHLQLSANRTNDLIAQSNDDQRLREIAKRQEETEDICNDLHCAYWRKKTHTAEETKAFADSMVHEWNSKMGKLKTRAVIGSRSYLMAGTPMRLASAETADDFYRDMNRQAGIKLSQSMPERELAALLTIARALNIPIDFGPQIPHQNDKNAPGQVHLRISDTIPIADIQDYAIHANQFLTNAKRWNGIEYPGLYDRWDVDLEELSELIDIGNNTRHALKSITPLDRNGIPNLLPIQKLMVNYEHQMKHLGVALRDKKKAFTEQFGTGGYDVFQPVEALIPNPARSISQPLFPKRTLEPCSGYTPKDYVGKALDKAQSELPMPPTLEDKFKALIPKEYFITQDELGGTISFCYRDLAPDIVRRNLTKQMRDGVIDIDDTRWSKMGITVEAVFTSPKIPQPITFLRTRIQDSTEIAWTKINWDAAFGDKYQGDLRHPIDGVAENGSPNSVLVNFAQKENASLAQRGITKAYHGLLYVGEEVLEAPKGISIAVKNWPVNIEKLSNGEGTDLLGSERKKATDEFIRKQISDAFGAKRLEFIDKHLTPDIRAQVGPIGDALRELDGSKRAMVEILKLSLGDMLDTKTSEGHHLFTSLLMIPGGDSMTYKLLRNKEIFANDATRDEALSQALTPAHNFIKEISKPNPKRTTEHAILNETILALEDYYYKASKTRGERVSKPITLSQVNADRPSHDAQILIVNELLTNPIEGASMDDMLDLAVSVSGWARDSKIDSFNLNRVRAVYYALRSKHSHKEALGELQAYKSLLLKNKKFRFDSFLGTISENKQ